MALLKLVIAVCLLILGCPLSAGDLVNDFQYGGDGGIGQTRSARGVEEEQPTRSVAQERKARHRAHVRHLKAEEHLKAEQHLKAREDEEQGQQQLDQQQQQMQKKKQQQQHRQEQQQQQQQQHQQQQEVKSSEGSNSSMRGRHVCIWNSDPAVEKHGMANEFALTNRLLQFAMERRFRLFWPALSPTDHRDTYTADIETLFGGNSHPFGRAPEPQAKAPDDVRSFSRRSIPSSSASADNSANPAMERHFLRQNTVLDDDDLVVEALEVDEMLIDDVVTAEALAVDEMLLTMDIERTLPKAEDLLSTNEANVDLMPLCVQVAQSQVCANNVFGDCYFEELEVTMPATWSQHLSSSAPLSASGTTTPVPTEPFHRHMYQSATDENDKHTFLWGDLAPGDDFALFNRVGLQCEPFVDEEFNAGGGVLATGADGSIGSRGLDRVPVDQSDCCVIFGFSYADFFASFWYDDTREFVRAKYETQLSGSNGASRLYTYLFITGGDAGKDAVATNGTGDRPPFISSIIADTAGVGTLLDFENTFLIVVHFRLGDVVGGGHGMKRMTPAFPIMCLQTLNKLRNGGGSGGGDEEDGDGDVGGGGVGVSGGSDWGGNDGSDSGDGGHRGPDGLENESTRPQVRVVLLAEAPTNDTEVQEIMKWMLMIDPTALHFSDDLSAAFSFHAMVAADILIASYSGFPRLAATVKPDRRLTISPRTKQNLKSGNPRAMINMRSHPLASFSNVITLDLGVGGDMCSRFMFYLSEAGRPTKCPTDIMGTWRDRLAEMLMPLANASLPRNKFDMFF
eukprot:TRINITY_DN2674_c0_g1_i2.p1 TRINITY_DN2674_c0_g1~~TRINITY_DN2674_c0_g1_i2.p1  ORF type:complete len:795 (+),score=195.15 TRINITY_DN2674_c0_g1_i2:118-2502(+)